MKLDELIKSFSDAVFDTDRDAALRIIHEAAAQGLSPEQIVFEVIVPVVEQRADVGEARELSLAQHFMTAQIASQIVEEMLPKFQRAPETVGRVVIGTSQGDLHSLGKRIVIGCLKAHMIEATDLGVSVAPERFVDEAVARNAQVIGISSMMVHTARSETGCLKVRQLLKERGLESKIKIIVGGAPYRFDPHLYQTVQADAWAESGAAAGRVIRKLIEEARP
jgi:methanogenic corrinoid protein MtbC1